MRLIFDWDEVKAKANLKKHKVSFEEGKTIFNRSGLIPRGLPRLSFPRKRESRKRSWIPGQARNDG